MRDLADPIASSEVTLFLFTHTQQPTLESNIQTNQKIYLSTMDLLVPATMKNAAKRDM